MICKFVAASTAALLALCNPALAQTNITQISASIILLGEPAPSEAQPAGSAHPAKAPDVLAAGERRAAGAVRAQETAVAADEKTSAIGAPPADAGESRAKAPLHDAELRRGY